MQSLPIYLDEIDIQRISCIRFIMPINDIGRDDVQIYVEYGIGMSDEHKLVCNVWAHILDTVLKGYLLSFEIDKPQTEDKEIDAIMRTLNESDKFYAVLHGYLDWADKNRLKE
ncbi:hypothetical protein [Hydrogenoanaerobacterium saccharovorans]|nr:hypothetical protein [Hydrogenoanaerobacterium saccharovorans]